MQAASAGRGGHPGPEYAVAGILGNSKATVAATHKIIPQLGLFSCDVVHSLGTVSDLASQKRVLFPLLCSCSQTGMNPVPEFIKRFTGLSWPEVGIRATTSRATP